MVGTIKESLLRQHVAPPRPVMAAGAGAVEKLLAVALPRTADELLDLQVEIQSVSFGLLDQSGVVATLNESDLICRMSGVGLGAGLIIVDNQFLAALIEFQTLGKVSGSPPAERSPTNTDVTFVSDILDQWLSDMARLGSDQGPAEVLLPTGYARDAGRLDLRAVELALDPGQYRSLTITVDFGEKAKLGKISIYTPKVAASGAKTLDATLGCQLKTHLLDAPVEMTAVLAREPLSLEEITNLRAGDVFPLPEAQLQSVRLEVEGGELIAMARLGQAGGKRAVRAWEKESPPEVLPEAVSTANVSALDHSNSTSAAPFLQVEASLAESAMPEPGAEKEENLSSVESLEMSDQQTAVS
ncbi:MAG: FliM/FliN family flagellar motor switch protein [Boseongicola sp.]